MISSNPHAALSLDLPPVCRGFSANQRASRLDGTRGRLWLAGLSRARGDQYQLRTQFANTGQTGYLWLRNWYAIINYWVTVLVNSGGDHDRGDDVRRLRHGQLGQAQQQHRARARLWSGQYCDIVDMIVTHAYTVVAGRVRYFVLLNYSYKYWSIIKTRDSFGICSSWGFQNCPWKLNLTKNCLS